MIGLFLDDVSEDFLKDLISCDVIVAKGMGCYESIIEQEIGIPALMLFRVKCEPVARDVGVRKGENVALFLEDSSSLGARKINES